MPLWDRWIAHPTLDAYWRQHAATTYIENVKAPVLSMAGWHDDSRGPTDYTDALLEAPDHPNWHLVMGVGAHKGVDYVAGDFGPDARYAYGPPDVVPRRVAPDARGAAGDSAVIVLDASDGYWTIRGVCTSQGSWALSPSATLGAGVRAELRTTTADLERATRVGSFVPRVSFGFRPTPTVSRPCVAAGRLPRPTINERYRGFLVGSVQTLPNASLSPERSFGGDVSIPVTRGRCPD